MLWRWPHYVCSCIECSYTSRLERLIHMLFRVLQHPEWPFIARFTSLPSPHCAFVVLHQRALVWRLIRRVLRLFFRELRWRMGCICLGSALIRIDTWNVHHLYIVIVSFSQSGFEFNIDDICALLAWVLAYWLRCVVSHIYDLVGHLDFLRGGWTLCLVNRKFRVGHDWLNALISLLPLLSRGSFLNRHRSALDSLVNARLGSRICLLSILVVEYAFVRCKDDSVNPRQHCILLRLSNWRVRHLIQGRGRDVAYDLVVSRISLLIP